jgi:hypothetical protein
MRTLADEYAEYSRVVAGDGSISPLVDTGFRFQPSEPTVYVPRQNPPAPQLYDHVHSDDIATREESSLRGVFFITVNAKAIGDRIVDDIARNILVRRTQEELDKCLG